MSFPHHLALFKDHSCRCCPRLPGIAHDCPLKKCRKPWWPRNTAVDLAALDVSRAPLRDSPAARLSKRIMNQGLSWRAAQAGANSEVFTNHESRNTNHGFSPWVRQGGAAGNRRPDHCARRQAAASAVGWFFLERTMQATRQSDPQASRDVYEAVRKRVERGLSESRETNNDFFRIPIRFTTRYSHYSHNSRKDSDKPRIKRLRALRQPGPRLNLHVSPRGEAKWVRGPSGLGASRAEEKGASRLARAGVLEPYVEHGKQAQRSPGGRIRVLRPSGGETCRHSVPAPPGRPFPPPGHCFPARCGAAWRGYGAAWAAWAACAAWAAYCPRAGVLAPSAVLAQPHDARRSLGIPEKCTKSRFPQENASSAALAAVPVAIRASTAVANAT